MESEELAVKVAAGETEALSLLYENNRGPALCAVQSVLHGPQRALRKVRHYTGRSHQRKAFLPCSRRRWPTQEAENTASAHT